MIDNFLPRGSGIDKYPKLILDKSNENKLMFKFSYHHMNDVGFYDGWTDHILTVKPSLAFGFELKITGQNKNEIKDYLYEIFEGYLNSEVVWDQNEGNYLSAK